MENKEIEALLSNDKSLEPRKELKDIILKRAKEVTPDPKPTQEINKKSKGPFVKRLILAVAMLVLVIGSVFTSLGLYNEEYQSIYIDINPSVELVVNRFGTVNEAIYHNNDAKKLFKDVKLTGMSAEESACIIVDKLNEGNYLTEGSEIYISALSKRDADTKNLLDKVLKKATKHAQEKGYKAEFKNGSVTKDDIEKGKEFGISPTKYNLIKRIIEKYPSYTVEELKDLKMNELNKIYNGKSNNGKK